MTGVDWFWAIVCNVIVIGGAGLGALLFRYWLVTLPHRVESPRSISKAA